MKASYLDGRRIIVSDQVYLYLFGTSYLGLPYNSDFQSLLNEGLLKYGSSLGSSPISIPQLSVYEELESLLASRYGYEEALLFPSGYAAGQAVVHFYGGQDYEIVYGNIAHPALLLTTNNIKEKKSKSTDSKLIAVDYIDPITFEKYDLNTVDVEKGKVLIDISHGLGLFDKEIKLFSESSNIILCGSLNKALGINAGLVLCSTILKKHLKSSMRYKTASAPSPSECYALHQAYASGLVQAQQVKLQKLISSFKPEAPAGYVENFPVLKMQDHSKELSDRLKQNEILIWRNRYPTRDSPMVNRAVFTAAHKEEDVITLLEQLQKLS